MTDWELLQQFREGSEEAFALLVKRHLNAVYAVALRQVGSAALAEEVAFSVFEELAQGRLRTLGHRPLISWLFQASRRRAIDVFRRESRQRKREEIAAGELRDAGMGAFPEEVLLKLDSAIEALREPDRDVILLRYYEEQSIGQIAEKIKTSEAAAQKRLERALEKLRDWFGRRGVAVSAASLGSVLSASVVSAAPASLGSSIIAGLNAMTLVASGSSGATYFFMTTTQKVAVIVVTAGALTTGLYQAVRVASLEKKVAELGRAQVMGQEARSQLAEAERKLALASEEIKRLQEQAKEIHRLRAQVSEMGREKRDQGNGIGVESGAREKTASEYLNRLAQLREAFERAPEQWIPEMQLVGDREMLEASILIGDGREDGLAKAMAQVRTVAKGKYALMLNRSLQKYVDANGGALPGSVGELGVYLEERAGKEALDRYELVKAGTTNDLKVAETIIQEKGIGATSYDTKYSISLIGAGYATPKAGDSDRTYGFSYTIDDVPAE